MGNKGTATQERILEASRSLFAQNGYCAVTMQDICKACGLSRGGLYRHFSSTEQIFTAIIEREQKRAEAALMHAKANNVPPRRMVATFLRYRLQNLMDPDVGIDTATAEFGANSEDGKRILCRRAQSSICILTEMIECGKAEGAFHCKDARTNAILLLCLLEGLGKHNALLPMDAQQAECMVERMLEILKTP